MDIWILWEKWWKKLCGNNNKKECMRCMTVQYSTVYICFLYPTTMWPLNMNMRWQPQTLVAFVKLLDLFVGKIEMFQEKKMEKMKKKYICVSKTLALYQQTKFINVTWNGFDIGDKTPFILIKFLNRILHINALDDYAHLLNQFASKSATNAMADGICIVVSGEWWKFLIAFSNRYLWLEKRRLQITVPNHLAAGLVNLRMTGLKIKFAQTHLAFNRRSAVIEEVFAIL